MTNFFRSLYLKVIGLIGPLLSDELYLKLIYRVTIGKKLNLQHPQSFNEKLQWLKLHDRKPEYTSMVDKLKVKEYVANTIGSEYIIPTLGVWDTFDEIDFESLPSQFVLKVTHDSGGTIVCDDKSSLDLVSAKKKIEKSLHHNYYYSGREWPYKNVTPRIIAEKYMIDTSKQELRDYKFLCFNGIAKVMYIVSDRFSSKGMCLDFFDMNFNHLPIKNGYPNASKKFNRPNDFNKMRELAENLSKGIPQVRIDFYNVNDRIYFGEITFYCSSGFLPFTPEKWDYKLGSLIDLPVKE